jgi:hypothetical protein
LSIGLSSLGMKNEAVFPNESEVKESMSSGLDEIGDRYPKLSRIRELFGEKGLQKQKMQ